MLFIIFTQYMYRLVAVLDVHIFFWCLPIYPTFENQVFYLPFCYVKKVHEKYFNKCKKISNICFKVISFLTFLKFYTYIFVNVFSLLFTPRYCIKNICFYVFIFKNKLSICIKRPPFKKLISHFKIYFYILNQNTSKYLFLNIFFFKMKKRQDIPG